MAAAIIGQQAPNFTFTSEQAQVSLSSLTGRNIILYFYPKDDTPGCTQQACDFRDNLNQLTLKGYTVIGVSPDTELSHSKFSHKYSLDFTLVADTDHSIAELYGVWKEKSMYGRTYMGIERTTFIINAQGIITHIIPKVKVKGHVQDILSYIG